MTTSHDAETMRYAFSRQPAIVLAVGIIGTAVVAGAAFLVFPPPAPATVVQSDTHQPGVGPNLATVPHP